MPKRTKIPEIPNYVIGCGENPETHIIQKSNPLLSLSKTAMTLPELKILDLYLARIDSHDEEKRTVRLERGEIEQALGVERILKKELEKRLQNLAQFVKVEDSIEPEGFVLVSLFEKLKAQRDIGGLWQIELTCTNDARKYIFNVENIGYLRYRLKNIVNLTSRYSYVLYLWLEHNRFRGTWEVEVDELKAILQCTADTYNHFYRLNDLILKKCQKELHEKTDCRFSYEPIKRGRAVRSVRFTIETLPPSLPEPEPVPQIEETEDWDFLEFLSVACTPYDKEECEFSRAEMLVIHELIIAIPVNRLPHETTSNFDNEDFRRYHYLAFCYKKMCLMADTKTIKNRFAYLCKIVKSEWQN